MDSDSTADESPEDGVRLIDEERQVLGQSTDGEQDSESEGEDLIVDGMERDYALRPELDTYEGGADIDEADYGDMEMTDRRAAEEEIDERDRMRARRRARLPAALLAEAEEEEEERPLRRRRLAEMAAGYEEEEEINLEDYHGRLLDWINNAAATREINRQLTSFLLNFKVTEKDTKSYYIDAIERMCAKNEASLEVNYVHLSEAVQLLAVWIADEPEAMLTIFNEVALNVTLRYFDQYDRIHSEIFVRIKGLPIADNLRDLRQAHLNGLIRVGGVVTRRTDVLPHLKHVKFNCGKCGYVLGPFVQSGNESVKIGSCPECQSRGPFHVNQEETLYKSYQRVTLQESPSSVPAGRVPSTMEVVLLNDLIDSCRPGEEVEITGVFKHVYERWLNVKFGFPAFSTAIEANFVMKSSVDPFLALTTDDEKQIIKASRRPDIAKQIIAAIAPSIWGHKDVKTALALSLFGGVAKDVHQKHRLRGDINTLLIGDPGTAKSQFLKYVDSVAPRSVFTTGQGASAVGLTASVRMDRLTRSWVLEGGAMVLADQGVCLIDEFDKMTDQDRVSIHEAMEQQSISVSKAGIVTSLQARCSVIAAANPIGGKYDASKALQSNVELTEPILSRFDLLCVVKDTVDPVNDERLASHVVRVHAGAEDGTVEHPKEFDVEPLEQDLLRKYILYARSRVTPRLNNINRDKISAFYGQIRAEGKSGGIVVTVRLVESIIRISEAHARMHLRDVVRNDDVDMAIRVVLESFINSQKYALVQRLSAHFRKFLSYAKDHNELLLFTLRSLFREATRMASIKSGNQWQTSDEDREQIARVLERTFVPKEDFEKRARELGIHNVSQFYSCEQFKGDGFKLDSRTGEISRYDDDRR